MSQQNVEIVRGAWDLWNRDDIDAMVACYTAGCEFDVTRYPSWPDIQGTLRGADEMRRFFSAFLATWDAHDARLETLLDAGNDRVLAVIRQRFRGRDSGAEVEMHWAQIYTLRNGLIARIDNYSDRSEAFEAVGLRE